MQTQPSDVYRMLFSRDVVVWSPRLVGLGLSVFLALFALDTLSNITSVLETTVAFAMGILPAVIVLVVVIIGWRHPFIAAVLFATLTIVYAVYALDHPGWIIVISGPLALESLLFLVSGMEKRKAQNVA